MAIRNLLLIFFSFIATASAQTLTVISGNGQLAHLGTGLSGGPITFQLLNGITPVPNTAILFHNTDGSNFLPLSANSAVTDSAGTATVLFQPAFLGFAYFETYTLTATSGPASVTFYEAASQPPITANFITSLPNVLYPLTATAGQPAAFHFVTSITGAIANVSTRVVPLEKVPPPPGATVQTGYCLEGATNPGGAVYSNADGQATCTPVLTAPNAALNPAYDTFTFNLEVGGAFLFGPFNYNIAPTPLAASLVSTMVLGQINTPISVPITVTGGVAPYTFTVPGGDGALPPGVTIGSNGVISGIPTLPGKYMITIAVTDHIGGTKTVGPLTLGVSAGAFQVTPASLPSAILGTPYSQTFGVTGGVAPYTWAVSAALPPGLTAALGDATGDNLVIAGTPTVAGTTTFTLLVTDSFGEIYPVPVIYSLSVISPIMFTTTAFPTAFVGTAYSASIAVTGGTAPLTFTTTALPNGLVLNRNDGSITGVPLTAGASPVTVTVTDSRGQTNAFATTFAVSSGPFTYPANPAIPPAVIGFAYSTQLPAPAGGVPPYTFSFNGATPAGFTLTTGGLLTTTPSVVGAQTLNIIVQDSATQVLSVALPFTVNSDSPTISALVNAASFLTGSPAPGELVSIFGTTLGPDPGAGFTLDSTGSVPSTLAGVQVTFGGIPAPLLYVSATQLNAVVPFGVVPGNVPVSVSYGGKTSLDFSLAIGPADPGVFLLTGTQGAILNADYTINGADTPASVGQFIQIYGTGAGIFTPAVTDGQLPTGPSSPSVPNVTVTIGGVQANVLYAGVAPGEVAGILQINVVVPAGVAAGPAVPVIVNIGNATSKAQTVTVAIN